MTKSIIVFLFLMCCIYLWFALMTKEEIRIKFLESILKYIVFFVACIVIIVLTTSPEVKNGVTSSIFGVSPRIENIEKSVIKQDTLQAKAMAKQETLDSTVKKLIRIINLKDESHPEYVETDPTKEGENKKLKIKKEIDRLVKELNDLSKQNNK